MVQIVRKPRKVIDLVSRIRFVRDINEAIERLFYVSHEIRTVRNDVYVVVASDLGVPVTRELIRYVNKCLVKKGAVLSYRGGRLQVMRVCRRDNV